MWHCVSIWWESEEISLADIGSIHRCNDFFCSLFSEWRHRHGHHRSICLHHVRQHQHLLLTKHNLNHLSGSSALMGDMCYVLFGLPEVLFRSTSKEKHIKEDSTGFMHSAGSRTTMNTGFGWKKQTMTVENQNGLLCLPLHPRIRNFWNADAKYPAVLITLKATVLAFYVRSLCVGNCQIIIRNATCLL